MSSTNLILLSCAALGGAFTAGMFTKLILSDNDIPSNFVIQSTVITAVNCTPIVPLFSETMAFPTQACLISIMPTVWFLGWKFSEKVLIGEKKDK